MAVAKDKSKSVKKVKAKSMKKAKTVRKNASRVGSGRMAKSSVWHGDKDKTSYGGVDKAGLARNKWGHIVYKTKSAASRANTAGWVEACRKARRDLNINGFAP